MRVDLPAPFSPMSACTSPARAVKSTRDRAFTPGKLFDRPVTDNMSVGLAQAGLGVVLGVSAVLDHDVLGDLLALREGVQGLEGERSEPRVGLDDALDPAVDDA